jgi:hypothetical protein
MSSDVAINPTVTVKNRIGLVLAAFFGLGDLISPLLGSPEPQTADSAGPPMAVLIADSVLGLVTLVAVVYTWRTGNRVGARIVAGTRILSVLTALPAFFVPGVPAPLVVIVAATIVLTVITVALVLSRPKPV